MSSMNSDLRWLAENEEWDGSFMFPYVFVEDGHVGYARRVGDSYHCFTKAQHQAAREELQDARDEMLDERRRESMAETSWSDWINWNATEDSVCPVPDGTLVQVRPKSGAQDTDEYPSEAFLWNYLGLASITAYRYELPEDPDARMNAIARNGNDGDHYSTPDEEEAWRAMQAKQPTYDPDDVAFVRAESSIAERYPQYYKDVRHLDAVDVYQVHQLFGIDDCSGCIQHASKKLLLSGVRTGGKPKRKDIEEARDTLTRWLQMEKSQ